MDANDQLEAATESLRIAWRDLRYDLSQQLHAEAPDLVAAITEVVELASTTHIPAPQLTSDERQPQYVPEAALYDDALDAVAPRRLQDVWQGHGDYDDPLIPQDDYEHNLVLARLREDPGADWHGAAEATPTPTTAVIIGGDGEPARRTTIDGDPVRGPEYDVDWAAKAEREVPADMGAVGASDRGFWDDQDLD